MALLKMIKDMSIEEILSIAGPFLYLMPIIILAITAYFIVQWFKSIALQRLFVYMDSRGIDEKTKRDYLANYLTRASNKDLIEHMRYCPVCGKRYSLKIKEYNSRGDTVEKWNHNGCTFCNTKVTAHEIDHIKYFAIERTPTTDAKEQKYKEAFDRLSSLIEYYKPYVDCTPDASEDKITVEITFR